MHKNVLCYNRKYFYFLNSKMLSIKSGKTKTTLEFNKDETMWTKVNELCA